jgi:integrase
MLPEAVNTFSPASLARILESMPRDRFQKTLVRRSLGKNQFWYIRPRVDVLTQDGTVRKLKRIPLGLVTREFGKREAEAKARQIMATINKADYVIQSQVRFGDFLKIYRNQHVFRRDGDHYFLSVSTQQKYDNHLHNHIEPAFRPLMLCEIDTKLIERWLDEKSKPRTITLKNGQSKTIAGLSWATRTDLRNILSSMFSKAKDWGYWQTENPVERVSVGRRRAAREKRKLTNEQIRLLLGAVPEDVRTIILVIMSTTLRISEVLGLQEKHFDFSDGTIQVEQRYYRGDLDTTKSERSTRIVRMGMLSESLKRRMTGNPEAFVFSVMTVRGETRDASDINQHFLRPAAKKLGLYWKGFGFHSFRREAITEIGRLDPMQAQKLAGHAHVDLTLLYTLDDATRQETAVRAIQERLIGEGTGAVN